MSGLLDDQFFADNFNTKLSPEKEAQFKDWALKNNRLQDQQDYDIRGFWSSGGLLSDNGHASDMYKKPNHPTFSDQSIYHGSPSPFGVFQGGIWQETPQGLSYTPSAEMLRNTHSLPWLQDYMSKYEHGVLLNMDKRK